jgi:hypothetical protein
MSTIDKSKLTLDEKGNLRPDFLFSYWCLAWFIIYYFIDHSTKSPIGQFIKGQMNPKLALIIAFIENFTTFLYMIYLKSDIVNLVRYVGMMLLIKVYPIYLIWSTPIRWSHDIFILSIIFIIYTIWLHINNTNLWKVYKKTFTSIHEGKTNTPLFHLMEKVGL